MPQTCPRCGIREFTPYGEPWQKGDPPRPAKSRSDNKTLICSECDTDEAMREHGGTLLDRADWADRK